MEDVRWQLFRVSICLMALAPLAHSQLAVGDTCTVRADGSQGTCRLISDCPAVAAQLQNRIRPTICGFSGSVSIVCCKRTSVNTFNSRPAGNNRRPVDNNGQNTFGPAPDSGEFSINRRQSGEDGKRISQRKCEEYKGLVTEELQALPLLPDPDPLSFTVSKCIQLSTPLIVGGEEAKSGEFPHMVAVGFKPSTQNEIQWACGGTLISERYVLTAGHCTYSREYDAEPSVCRLGGHNLVSREDTALDVAIDKVVLHPSYTSTNKYNDIALLLLERTVKFTDTIRPACLWQRADIGPSKAIATGWGKVGYTRDRSNVLMKVLLDLLQPARCRERIQPTKKIPRGVISEQLCAGGGTNDTCLGDSGGPLTITLEENRCVFYLVALTSFGYGCGNNVPGIYTRISSYLPWIEGEVWPDN